MATQGQVAEIIYTEMEVNLKIGKAVLEHKILTQSIWWPGNETQQSIIFLQNCLCTFWYEPALFVNNGYDKVFGYVMVL